MPKQLMLAGATDRAHVGLYESLLVMASALLVASVGLAWSCVVRSQCVEAGTCVAPPGLREWPLQCSFTTVVSLVADLQYHNGASVSRMQSLARGACGVGERLQLSPVDDTKICVLVRPYPDALNRELMNPSAATDHQRACGEWIHGRGGVQGHLDTSVDYLSSTDSDQRIRAIRHAEQRQYDSASTATTNLGKFRATCESALLGGAAAVRASGQLAYTYLVQAAAIDAVSDSSTALTALGVLGGHYCDTPVLFGLDMQRAGYSTTLVRGVSYSSQALADALELVQEGDQVQGDAFAANEWVNKYAPTARMATREECMVVLRGATERARGAVEDAAADLRLWDYTPHLDGFVHLLSQNTSVLANPWSLARAYLKGVAGLCAFSLESLVDRVGHTARGDGLGTGEWLRATNAGRASAEALGALKAPVTHEPLLEIDDSAVQNASTITLSQLISEPADDIASACLSFTRKMFPDDIDAIHFGLTVTPHLYDRMRTMVETVREALANVLGSNRAIRDSIMNPDAMVHDVRNVRVRIPGAPRGTWAGATRDMPRSVLDSADGLFVMAAKQARAVYLDRHAKLAYDATDPCEGPSYWAALTPNAYIWPSMLCSYYLLGMSVRPWADDGYDDTSLAARFGWVIAHELSHTNRNTPYKPYVDTLLVRYPHVSTRNEAFADTLASLGVLETGLVSDREALCQHVSQLWCARVPASYYDGAGGWSHPKARAPRP